MVFQQVSATGGATAPIILAAFVVSFYCIGFCSSIYFFTGLARYKAVSPGARSIGGVNAP
jgi:hypothetical protein